MRRSKARARAWTRTRRLAALVALLSGCAPVAPWQRGTLARPEMTLEGAATLEFGESHAHAYREGSSGAGRVVSGGCGCN